MIKRTQMTQLKRCWSYLKPPSSRFIVICLFLSISCRIWPFVCCWKYRPNALLLVDLWTPWTTFYGAPLRGGTYEMNNIEWITRVKNWGFERQFFILVIFLTNSENISDPSVYFSNFLWSSGKGQARKGKEWPLRRKALKLKPLLRAYTKVKLVATFPLFMAGNYV